MHLDRFGGTPYPQALRLPMSYLAAYFESETYTQDAKNSDAKSKTDALVIGRLDTVIKAIVLLARSIGRGR